GRSKAGGWVGLHPEFQGVTCCFFLSYVRSTVTHHPTPWRPQCNERRSRLWPAAVSAQALPSELCEQEPACVDKLSLASSDYAVRHHAGRPALQRPDPGQHLSCARLR